MLSTTCSVSVQLFAFLAQSATLMESLLAAPFPFHTFRLPSAADRSNRGRSRLARRTGRSGWKEAAYGAWRQVASAQRFIEELQSSGLDEVGLLGSVNARKGVKIGGRPALVLVQESSYELRRLIRIASRDLFPRGRRTLPPWHNHMPVPDENVAPIEIEDGSVRKQFSQARRLPQACSGFQVYPGHTPVQPG